MRVELKEFQATAVTALATKLQSMRRRYEQDGEVSSICLASPTGSGKTIMCAATIEALFFGDDDLGLMPDENAVVLWLSDSPSLNEQTLVRFANASDRLASSLADGRHLVTVTNDFCASRDMLEPRHVYFLSKDLLSKNGLLTKGGEANSGRVFWDVVDNTIKDPERNLYLFIDEAHRGLGKGSPKAGDTATIYANLIDGLDDRSPVPIVVGISATPQKFETAMERRADRVRMPRVPVTPREVQESGLLKDVIELRVPEKDDPLEHQYLTMACKRYVQACDSWEVYCVQEGESHVNPLLLVQAEDNISPATLVGMCDQIMSLVPGLNEATSFANVFGEHKDISAGKYLITYVEPEFVQETSRVRVLFAKEAVSNGWDCPRAEVIFSQRRRSDSTYIAQLVGRMVRTPLARRVESDDLLNSVACYLPGFNPESTKDVVDYLMGRKDDMGESSIGSQNIVLNPVTVTAKEPRTWEDYQRELEAYEKNKKAIERFEAARRGEPAPLSEAPVHDVAGSQAEDPTRPVPVVPSEGHGATDQLDIDSATSEGDEMPEASGGKTPAADSLMAPIPMSEPKPPTEQEQVFTSEEWRGIREAFDSIPVQRIPKKARNEFRSLLDTASLLVESGLDPAAASDVNHQFVQKFDGFIVAYGDEYEVERHEVEVAETVRITLDKLHGSETSEQEEAQTDAEGLRKAARDADIKFCKEFTQSYRRANFRELGRPECDLRLASAVRTEPIVGALEKWAADCRKGYFDKVEGAGDYDYLSDAHKQKYDELARETEGKRLTRMEWPRNASVSDNFEKYPRHIVMKEDGLCPLDLDEAERLIVETELARERTVAFYRNPSGSMSAKAFSIPYMSSVGRKALHPDFLFFARDAEGKIWPSIVDPHADFLGDTLAKLRGYVAYLRDYPDVFKQVLFVGVVDDGKYRVLNLLKPEVQEAIDNYSDVDCKALFYGSFASDYH
ncbi:DEAD/DEAH box helicase [Paratractidigestivibacter sp.]|uniref:DEAD/DEAH box helicase n=1 Tax=Paratractidigestivibacter sp. TaxID=2847316 RepID=UPI002ACB1740|nr:DEAD/DEAH box helicase family protein [Paratractidigestivibacter sp.]